MIDTLEDIKELVLKKKVIIVGVLIVFVLGLLFGSIYVTILSNNDKKELLNNIGIYFDSMNNISFHDKLNIFKDCFIKNIIYVLFLWLLGISIIGFPIILIMVFYKSFLVGFSISSIFAKYKLLGLYKIIIYIFPSKIILLALSLFLAVYSINISNRLVNSCLRKKSFNFNAYMGKYFLILLISIIIVVITSLFEAFLTPLFYNIKIG